MKHKRMGQVAAELSNGKKLIKEEKKVIKRAKGRVAKDNKARALKVMKKSVAALEDQQDIIEQGGEIPVK